MVVVTQVADLGEGGDALLKPAMRSSDCRIG